jgi:Helix-turn-helix of DDE superfamily endonuclease
MKQSTKICNITITRGFLCFFYRAALPLSSRTLNYAAGVIRRHLKAIGSRWRKLNPGQEALLVLAYLRKGETFEQLAAGFGIGRTTAWRYVNETVELLAARAPKRRSSRPRRGTSCGSPARCQDQCTTRRPNGSRACSTRWRKPAWSPSRTKGTRAAPGRRSRTRAGASPSRRSRPTGPTPSSAPLAKRANAQLKVWKILTKLRCCPWRAGQLAKAIHVLQLREA